MQQVETEVRSLYEFCRRAGLDDDEIEDLSRPLRKFARGDRTKRTILGLVCALLVSASVYRTYRAETLQWHASAIARIAMVKILPFWDWSSLFYERCLIDRNGPTSEGIGYVPIDCNVCEAIASVSRIRETSYEDILNRHLIRGAPAIVTDANDRWITSTNPNVNITRILLEDDRFLDTNPCSLRTNFQIGKLKILLEKIDRIGAPGWFLHFQNCELRGIKTLRTIVPRPYFLSPHIPPAQYSWLLMSDKYSAPRYKPLELETGLIILSQLKGSTLIRLAPKSPCEDLCPNVKFEVQEGETLVLPNAMWNFEYVPDENFFNIAVLTENEWNGF